MKRGSNLSLDLFGDRLNLNREGRNDGGEHKRMLRTLMLAAQGELTGRQMQCVILCYKEGKSVSEIAAELGLAPSTVSRHLKKARLRLQKILRYCYPSLRKKQPGENQPRPGSQLRQLF
ncbi:MAG: sigma-70 family RNA polymerase sigma factor [Oscillospiraceae bacterium]|jgi:DNA-directed RNA polymerase specialized sigma subunit|nr:sigma-70 family RNA polymerase sigma factor [Oscillospiraceae bacterium]